MLQLVLPLEQKEEVEFHLKEVGELQLKEVHLELLAKQEVAYQVVEEFHGQEEAFQEEEGSLPFLDQEEVEEH